MAGAWSPKAAWQRDPLVLSASVLVFLSIVFGGGGVEGPLRNGFLEAGGALLLVACAAFHFSGRLLPPQAWPPLWLLAAILLVITIQLAPLPREMWTSLPGREAAAASLGAAGLEGWRPLSLDPEATRRFATALLLPAGILLATLMADDRGLILLARSVVLGGVLSALLAAVQLSLGTPKALSPFGVVDPGTGTGLFINRNHQATMMVLSLVATSLLIRMGRPHEKIRHRGGELRLNVSWLLFPLFILLAVGSQSRAGIVLLIPATSAAVVIALNSNRANRMFAIVVGMAAAVLAVIIAAGSSWDRLAKLYLSPADESRLISMPDMIFTLQQYWPAGSGFGTFVPVFQANENLEVVGDRYVNRAHNEYIEVLIEAGVGGAALLAIAAVLLILRGAQLFRMPRRAPGRATAFAGLTILILVALHSIVDYPLRTDALAAVAAVATGWFFHPGQPSEENERRRRRRRQRGFGNPMGGFGSDRAGIGPT